MGMTWRTAKLKSELPIVFFVGIKIIQTFFHSQKNKSNKVRVTMKKVAQNNVNRKQRGEGENLEEKYKNKKKCNFFVPGLF